MIYGMLNDWLPPDHLQDRELTTSLTEIPGVPLIYIVQNTMVLDKPSACSLKHVEAVQLGELVSPHQQQSLQSLKAEQGLSKDGEERRGKKRKRKSSNPNPLSCLKKKKKPMPQQPKTDGEKKRSRHRKRSSAGPSVSVNPDPSSAQSWPTFCISADVKTSKCISIRFSNKTLIKISKIFHYYQLICLVHVCI